MLPLWRPDEPDYESFAEVLARVGAAPTYLPWPMSPGWRIADFGCVAPPEESHDPGTSGLATITTVVGTSDLDGDVEVTVVSEDPGVGLGARCAGARSLDAGDQVGVGPPSVRVHAGGRHVPLWDVDTEGDAEDDPLASVAFTGEADGRWLWLVLRPASAALLLHDEWLLADVTGFGPEALEMPFGGPRRQW